VVGAESYCAELRHYLPADYLTSDRLSIKRMRPFKIVFALLLSDTMIRRWTSISIREKLIQSQINCALVVKLHVAQHDAH